MQKFKNLKQLILLIGLLMPTVWCDASDHNIVDGYSGITIQQGGAYQIPKGSTIQASIDGHSLTVVFTENLGQVAVEITTATGATVEYLWIVTPNGLQTYLPLTGDYVITFTLPNGDEYYGEFTVTD
jgi:hypothetical protein